MTSKVAPLECGQRARASSLGEQQEAILPERTTHRADGDRSNRGDVVEVYYSSDDDDEGSDGGGEEGERYNRRRLHGCDDKDGSSDDDDDDDDSTI